MTIKETPVVDYLTFEVWDSAAKGWRDLAEKATTVTIQRGGTRNTGANKIGVGTLDATLFGAIDLTVETALKPNSPIRVVQPIDYTVPRWESESRSLSSSVFTSNLPAALASVAHIDGFGYPTDNDNGTTTALGTGVTFTANAPATVVSASYANRLASRVIDADVVLPGNVYTIDVSASNAGGWNYPILPTRIVAYAYDTVAGALGDLLGTSDPRPFSRDITPWPTFKIDAPGDGLGVLLTVQLVTSATVQNTQALEEPYFVMAFEPVNVGVYKSTTPRFTGTIADVSQLVQFDKASGIKRVFTSLYAVDAVQPLANTKRYGAVSASGLGYQPWAERIQQLATSAPVPVNTPPASERDIYTWPGDAIAPFAAGSRTESGYSEEVTLEDGPALQFRATRTSGTDAHSFTPYFTLDSVEVPTAGRYRVDFDLTLVASTGVTQGKFIVLYSSQGRTPVTLPAVGNTTHVSWEFTAKSPESGPNFQGDGASAFTAGAGTREFTLQMSNYSIRAIGDPKGYQLSDVAYESDLASHFDLACNSVGARWWVDRDGIVQFSRTFTALTADAPGQLVFSDVRAPGNLEYVDLGLAYDTRNVVNALTLNQHGRVPDTAAENAGNADDYAVTITAPSSIRRWGSRAAAIDTCLYVGPGFENSTTVRAREVTSQLGTPTYSITSVQWNAQQDPSKVPALDIYTAVSTDYESLSQVARVIGIKETITPTRWLIDLDLTDILAGATFNDLANVWGGDTFTQIDALLGDRTFTQFNGDPLS